MNLLRRREKSPAMYVRLDPVAAKACLEARDSRCFMGCYSGPEGRCRARLARWLREFAAMEDKTPSANVTRRSAMLAAAAELEAIGRRSQR